MSGSTFKDAIKLGFSRWKDWKGRSSRAEYWWLFLFIFLVNFAFVMVLATLDPTGVVYTAGLVVALVLNIVSYVVMLATSVRRLHDTDRTGWWVLLAAVPIVGVIVLLVFYAQKGDALPNRFGLPPI